MDDIDMNSYNNQTEDDKTNKEEDPCVALDNIQKKLKIITETFTNSLFPYTTLFRSQRHSQIH